jgi:hypothetical protein
MRAEEAAWVGDVLSRHDVSEISPLIELGTTSKQFREVVKPHIANNIHHPQRGRGVQIVTSDLFPNDGVDIAGDIFSQKVQDQLVAVGAKCILVCNFFEHVVDAPAFARVCDQLIPSGGLAIVTVPYSYPYHLDPIDTLFRPSPEAIVPMFPGYAVLEAKIVKSTTHADDLRAASSGASILPPVVKDILKSLALRGGLQRSLARVHRLGWLFRPYTVSCVALRKNH